jgi:hypothetical protein
LDNFISSNLSTHPEGLTKQWVRSLRLFKKNKIIVFKKKTEECVVIEKENLFK